MKHLLKVIWGTSAVANFQAGQSVVDDLPDGCVKQYSFNTEAEKLAFLQGIEECAGWNVYLIVGEQLNTHVSL